jgi:aspartyl-tRNA(Asn)/glutamyl-tRNA(Gln) amidotransferase subunit A
MENKSFTIGSAHDLLAAKKISCRELITGYLDQIKKRDSEIHAFLDVYEDDAFRQARAVDEKIQRGEMIGVLEGIPIAVKDNILIKGKRATAASRVLEHYTASYDATVIKKLKDAGVIFLGKTNMDEFAMGSSTEHSAFGVTKNPHDLDRVPGGSSGGSAAAVAADECVAALGSDTGGSIRQPAAFCGVVGLKPTYGAVSRYGLIAMASSLDQIGPITRMVNDAKIIFEVIRGNDPQDATSVARNFQFPRLRQGFGGQAKLRIGIPKEYLGEGLDDGIRKEFEEARTFFQKEGFEVKDISLPHTRYALATYYLIMPAEASANLARYDNVRYASDRTRFGSEVKRRIILGTFVLSHGYYDAYYVKAQKVRALIRQDFLQAFEDVDMIAAPTTPAPPFRFGEKTDDALSMYLSDIYTVTANLAGIPALSLPLKKGSPFIGGLQLMARPFHEDDLFELGSFYDHH